MWFIHNEHKRRFEKLRQKSQRVDDPFFDSALYALSVIDKADIIQYVNPDRVLFSDLMRIATSWSKGERAIIQVAWELFNGGPDPEGKWGIHSIFGTLGGQWDKVALEAIRIRYQIY